ncbi:PepSY-associated TM helix domain-containing protein [Sphingomonas adhaesiva]|uniref:PepSY domain-containing protein n=1 Tax=Sphingomonas adhaesiva TaxID=28212 RepID=A0A2A4I339_9SPHN|nr:PepSY-associated TM helix domain-containing protein [Sphingomonas adhaesiva]PCG12909.1 PepSY domain-containing protein [Sphingomonas adhaesiva]
MNNGVKQDAPRGWPLSPATVRAVLSGHGILGLAFAAIIYLVCLTGTLAVFAHDIARWEQPDAPSITAFAPGALDRAVRSAQVNGPAHATLYVALPSMEEAEASITAYTPALHREWAADRNGTLTERRTPIADFLIDLHVALHLPRAWGGFIVGLTGVALLSSLISGILAHPRIFKDAFHLRRGGARRLQEADMHNRLGIWALPFHVAIALTGALLGLSTLIVGVLAMLLYRGDTAKVYGLFTEAPPAINAVAAPLPPLEPLLAEARRRSGRAMPHQLIIERAGRADARITVSSERERLLVPQDTAIFDVQGRVVKDQHPADLVLGTKMLGGIGQLHFGWFGGLPVRLLYGLLGLALCIVTSSGVTIWLARRRDRGRAVPLWERLWAGITWGQPLALALVGIFGLFAPAQGSLLVWVWLGTTAGSIIIAGAARGFDASNGAVRVRHLVAASTLALALVYLVTRQIGLSGMAVELALLVGVGLLLRHPPTKHRREGQAAR